MRNPYKKIIFNFTKEIPVKLIRFSEKSWILQKKSLKIFFQKKIIPKIFPNFSRKIDKLDTIFSKTLSKRVFLKILENFSNLSQI